MLDRQPSLSYVVAAVELRYDLAQIHKRAGRYGLRRREQAAYVITKSFQHMIYFWGGAVPVTVIVYVLGQSRLELV